MIKHADTIVAISGSSRRHSSNEFLLKYLQANSKKTIEIDSGIHNLPLFSAAADQHPWPKEVLEWRKMVSKSKALIICTPEYLHNLPASIKNALEWLASSGELDGKPVLPITFTPAIPRGQKAMKSLLWSLEALNAQIVTQLDLYKTEIKIEGQLAIINEPEAKLISAALNLLS